MKTKVLLIDDDIKYNERVAYGLKDEFDCIIADSIDKGMELLSENPQVVLLDLEFGSSIDGIDAIPKIKAGDPDIPIIVVTKHSEYQLAVQAIKSGAADYCVKSPDIKELIKTIQNSIKTASLENHIDLLKTEISSAKGELIGKSIVLQKLRKEIEKAANADYPVLITGETGSGKELVARKIHENSERLSHPFIAINIAGINQDLVSSELFGHEKGAFTGALKRKKGLFEVAGKGTIFLDEIGDLSMESQIKLLRVIEEKSVRRVGGTQPIDINARFLTATFRSLKELVENGKFREDLFYRLNVKSIQILPLRERKEDIPELIEYFLSGTKRTISEFDDSSLELFQSYHWPGNVRQLKNIIEIIAFDNSIKRIDEQCIQRYFSETPSQIKNNVIFHGKYFDVDYKKAKEEILDSFRKQYIEKLLKKTNGNIAEASKLSGLSRNSIYKLLNK